MKYSVACLFALLCCQTVSANANLQKDIVVSYVDNHLCLIDRQSDKQHAAHYIISEYFGSQLTTLQEMELSGYIKQRNATFTYPEKATCEALSKKYTQIAIAHFKVKSENEYQANTNQNILWNYRLFLGS